MASDITQQLQCLQTIWQCVLPADRLITWVRAWEPSPAHSCRSVDF